MGTDTCHDGRARDALRETSPPPLRRRGAKLRILLPEKIYGLFEAIKEALGGLVA